MASSQVGSIPAKMSFAKVAAMRAPTAPAPHPNPTSTDEKKTRTIENSNARKTPQNNSAKPPNSPRKVSEPVFGRLDVQAQSEYVATAIEGLSLVKDSATALSGPHSAESGESLEDDQSHLSNSSTKLQGFDTKSMASVTTFAMDEKESIRPDDSASVRAVDDDEASNAPGRELSFQRDAEHLPLGSRQGLRPSTSGVTIAPRRYHTLTLTNPPRFGDLPVSPIVQAESPDQGPMPDHQVEPSNEIHERATPLPVAPDEKLLDALATPKDRLPLLQIEEKLLTFIANPRIEFLDLPPQNAYARLLAHKLADYYMLAHQINDDGTSIRLFKTPLLTMPTPLHVLASSIPMGPIQGPTAMTIKVLRRAGLDARQRSIGGSTAASSSAPSKATSDAGQETTSEEGITSPLEGTPNRDKSKLTREEREAQYKAARDRIFGDFQESVTSESASNGEHSASLSRSSSSSGKRKARKLKTPKDDSFEARSAFIPSYTPLHMHNIQTQYQPQYSEQAYQSSYQPTNGFAQGMNYGATPTQSFPGYDPTMSFNGSMPYGPPTGNQQFSPSDSWSPMQPSGSTGYFNYSQSPNGYQQNMSSMPAQVNNQYMQQPHLGLQQNQGWAGNQYQPSYPQQSMPSNTNPNSWTGYQPSSNMNNPQSYAYGHLPNQNYGGNPSYNPQHPVPGSYSSRSLFNPQTRSFVPSNASSRTGGRNGRKKPSPSSSQNRGNSISKPFGSDVSMASTLSAGPRGFDRGSSNSSSPKLKEDSLQQKYGAPAHLPKKPPPSQVPSSFDVDSIINNTSGSGSSPLVVNGGVVPGGGNVSSGPSA